MAQLNIFDYAELNRYLRIAITKNCRIEPDVDGNLAVGFQEVSGIVILVSQETIELLSQEIQLWASKYGSSAPQSFAELLTGVAVIAKHVRLKVIGPPENQVQLDLLKRRVSGDFALICALSMARSRGYAIQLEKLSWEALFQALMAPDEDLLARIFQEALAAVRPGNTSLKPSGTNRVLSRNSYWNLVSTAEAERWDDSVIIRLIEEHLSPAPHPHLVQYSLTEVSGDEWRELYEWLYVLDGLAA